MRVHTYYGDIMANARHGTPPHTSVQFNTTLYGFCGII